MAGPRRSRRAAGGAGPAFAVEVTIAAIGARGDGIADDNGRRLYIPLTVPGDRVRARPLRRRGDGEACALEEILSPGPGRTRPPCPHFGRCGGCALQHLADDAYAAWKVDRLVATLAQAGIGGFDLAPLACTPPQARRRASLAALRPASGAAAVVGFNERESHAVVDLARCPVLHPAIEALIPALRRLLTDLLAPGERAQVAVSRLEGGLDVVVGRARAPDMAAREHLAAFAADVDAARVSWRRPEDPAAEPVAQRRPVGARFGGVFVALSPGAFVQASAEGEAALVAAVLASLESAGTVADLYAGAGTFTLPAAAAGMRVHAVDADEALVAALAAAARTLPAVTVEARDLCARPLAAAELARFDAAILDPPRAGARAQAGELARSAVPVVAALSCRPETFARDARILSTGGFRLERLWPIDQFLWSPHLELAALFRR